VVLYRGNRWTGRRPRCWLPLGRCRFWVLTRDHKVAIDAMPFRGLHRSEVRLRGMFPWEKPDALVWQQRRGSVKKVKLTERSSVKHLAAMETEVFGAYLAVLEALALLQYDDGSPRQPGYLGVWTNGATWFARFNDKDADASLTAEGRTLDEALGVLALLLGADDAPWEPNSRKKGKRA
jgi:hypothetical protein